MLKIQNNYLSSKYLIKTLYNCGLPKIIYSISLDQTLIKS